LVRRWRSKGDSLKIIGLKILGFKSTTNSRKAVKTATGKLLEKI